ncbi:MAG TPA: MFS transporter [Candidatus Limiplasma sp.]|nr:MFS transporter [Candidatus Limiplasma sp.]
MIREKKSYLGFLVFNAAFFMMDTTQSYFNIYLNQIGITKTGIGFITAASALIALSIQPMLGVLADKSKSKNRMLQGLIFLSAILYPLILVSENFLYILVVFTAFTMIKRFLPSMNNSMTLEYVQTNNLQYGPLRMMGAIGYSAVMIVVGKIADIGTQYTFYAYCVICAVNILLIFLLPPIHGHRHAGDMHKFTEVLKNKTIVKLIAFATLMSMAQGVYFSYFSIYFTTDLGGSASQYGVMLSIAACCEIPFLFFADRIIRRLGTKRMLFIICLLNSVRWLATYLIREPGWQMAVQTLNFLNILMTVAVTIKLSQTAAPQFKTTVLTMAATVQTIASLLISSLLGGILADLIGIRSLFLIATVICLLTGIVFYCFVFKDSLDQA